MHADVTGATRGRGPNLARDLTLRRIVGRRPHGTPHRYRNDRRAHHRYRGPPLNPARNPENHSVDDDDYAGPPLAPGPILVRAIRLCP